MKALLKLSKQAKHLLFYLRNYLPVIALLFTTAALIHVFGTDYYLYRNGLEHTNYGIECFFKRDLILKHFGDCSLIAILCLAANGKHYKWLSWLCIYVLAVLWVLNTVYIIFDIESDLYYCFYIVVIYATFVSITIYKLINRC